MAKTRKSGRNGMPAVGTRAMVWHGTAHHTSGGLTKDKLMMNKRGKIVSRKAHARGKKSLKHLIKAGYKAKKGTFKLGKKMLRK
jgi:DVNP family